MKNSIQNQIQTLWVLDYVIWTNQCTSNVSRSNQSCFLWLFRWLCSDLFEQCSDIFENIEETSETCDTDVEMITKEKSHIEIRKMWVLHSENRVSRTFSHTERTKDALR